MKLKSPFKQYPGTITIPDVLDAEKFNQWWERIAEIEENEEETRHDVFQVWDGRFHFIESDTIKLPEGYELEQTGLKLPSPALAQWYIEQTNPLLENATNLKNFLGLSDNT